MTLDNNFVKKFGGNFSQDIKLSNYSWFNLGGNAEYFYKAKDRRQLFEFLTEAKKKNLKTKFGPHYNYSFGDHIVRGLLLPYFPKLKHIDHEKKGKCIIL